MANTYSLLAAFVVMLLPTAPQPTPAPSETCPGCADQTQQPTVTGNGTDFGVSAFVTTHDGACWYVGYNCVESYPCTPYLAVHAWANSFNQPWCSVSGVVCNNTVDIDSVNIGWSSGSPRSVYRGYSGVPCGSNCGIALDLVVHYNDASYFYSWPVAVTGTFVCSTCTGN